jgi:uncharacterized protein GlcG (DUF336 family)
MKTKPCLTHEDCRKIMDGCIAEALAHKWPVTIAIVDDGGHLLMLDRLDGAAPSSAEIGPGKARMAALGRRETKGYEDIINGGRFAFLSAASATAMRGVMMEGAVPIMVEGQCVGAVGVSGVKSAEDAQVAKAGIAAL